MKWKLAIFDLDGTLIDTLEDLGNAVDFALQSQGLPGHSLAEYRNFIGHGVRDLVWRSMPEEMKGDEKKLDELLAVFMDYYYKHIDVYSTVYPGIPELLSMLRDNGVLVALASNKFQKGCEKLMTSRFPAIDFVAIKGGRPDVPLKPDPAVIREILGISGVKPSDAVMIGDSGTDVATAAAAGIDGISVTWGFKNAKAAMVLADYSVDSVYELGNLFTRKGN